MKNPTRPFTPTPLSAFTPSHFRAFAPSRFRPSTLSRFRPFAPSPLRSFAPSLLCTFALSCLIACSSPEKQTTPKIEQDKAIINDTEKVDADVSISFLADEAAFNGIFVLSPRGHATVALSIEGIVKNTSSRLSGEYVQKGELLATLENPEFINLQQSYLEASAQCDYLEAEYKRQEVLSQEDVTSQKRLQQCKSEFLSMKSRKDAAAAQLTMLGLSPQSIITDGMSPLLEVRAPISGYLSNIQINAGKHIAVGEPLCEIIDKSAILIKLTIYEKDLNRIETGDKIDFRVNGMGDERFEGEIISIGQRVDNISRSLEVHAKVINNHSQFRPGMYVSAMVVKK